MKKYYLVFVLCLSSLSAEAGQDITAVSTKYGMITGEQTDSAFVYRGIPYAAPPVGKLRWAPPAPPAAWSGVRSALQYGANCPQIPTTSVTRKVVGRENCLFLNVWKPPYRDLRDLPVMVFIHGGANVTGSGHDELFGVELFNGQYLSQRGPAVIVTLNYRLGALGFLAHPSLSRKSGYGGSGNYGILDQIQALRWVKENIAAFGGNPANVTVFGESAGAIDILAMLASPLAQGLFSKAIVQSGFLLEVPLKQAEAVGQKLSTALGCEKAAEPEACLRSKAGAKIIAAADGGRPGKVVASTPTIDGYVLNAPVLDTFRSTRFEKVPLLIGSNLDEMTTLGPAVADTETVDDEEQYRTRVLDYFGADAPAVLALYPASAYSSPRDAMEVLMGDLTVHCPTRRIARAYSARGTVWRYVFSHTGDSPLLAPFRAGHGLELPYVFHTQNPLVTSDREYVLSEQMATYWLNFAARGNPNASGLPAWPLSRDDEFVELDIEIAARADFHKDKCDFFDRINR